MVEHGDAVGQPVSLFEVLRGQEDRHATRDELADDVPHDPPAARIEPGRGLVQEDDAWVADKRHRQIEPPTHAARVGRDDLVGGVDQVEALEQLGHALPGCFGVEVLEPRHEGEVFGTGQEAVDSDRLAGDADCLANFVRVLDGVMAVDQHLAGVGRKQRRQDPEGCCLARAIRPEQRENRAGLDAQVDAVEDDLLAECLAQPGHLDRPGAAVGRHATPPMASAARRSDVEVFDRWLLGRWSDHVVQLGRDALAQFSEGRDDLDRRGSRR